MTWRFTLIHDGTETVIQEPYGWDSMTKTVRRDLSTHGVFFDFSDNDLQFEEEAYFIIKEEYILKAIDGNIGLRIEWLGAFNYWLFYTGKLDFASYNEVCGESCSIKCGLQASETELLIKNRTDTSVDLTGNIAYDGVTVLDDYPFLDREVDIPSKSLLVTSKARNLTDNQSINFADDFYWKDNTLITKVFFTAILPGFKSIDYTEIGDTNFYDQPQYLSGAFNNIPAEGSVPFIELKVPPGLLCQYDNFIIDLDYHGSVSQSASSGVYTKANLIILKLPKGLDETDPASYTSIFNETAWFNLTGNGTTSFSNQANVTVSMNFGDRLYLYYFLVKSDPSHISSFFFTMGAGSYCKVTANSTCPSSRIKTYFLHEAGSRIVEHITNNQYKFKSEYYGRTDSEPYAYANDGCGGLRTLSNGLQIRRAILQDNTPPKVFLSFKDFFESLSAIDCIGMGIENTDVRVEPIKYFYSDEIIFVADLVNEINTTVRNEWNYNQFNFGYDKFEVESTNGLDAMHTKRQYRSPLSNTDTKLEKFSKVIADPYAIEVTRRKFGLSDDWRYDASAFLICLKRSAPYSISLTGTFYYTSFYTSNDASAIHKGDILTITGSGVNSGTFTVDFVSTFGGGTDTAIYFAEPVTLEGPITIGVILLQASVTVDQGNITTPENIFDPATVINYAITPVRNAMRWFKWFIQGVRDYANAKALFSSGEGNFVAKGLNSGTCVVEGEAIAENAPIELASFADPDDARPFTVPEKVVFKYPMGLNEFVDVSVAKYGKVQYRRAAKDPWSYGWIDTLKYSPNDGEAEFTLITSKE
ncbi:hypothetical protein [Segetibacter aerophilus]|uniref:Uncharacterized protein n=1 Tax=Segetibacter aerophilus TaxID=670293 RepID=A0A512B9Y9_9BACT|nr:hypothetical protein [Segetibacter aerophilus]GEO08758.1 hypothetical protein SAE01_12540 [Segetibacter aerophilus]